MNFNESGETLPGIPTRTATLLDEIIAYDNLPSPLRKILQYGPIKFSALVMESFRQRHTDAEIIALAKKSLRENFPDWKPLKGDDFDF